MRYTAMLTNKLFRVNKIFIHNKKLFTKETTTLHLQCFSCNGIYEGRK